MISEKRTNLHEIHCIPQPGEWRIR